MDRVLIVDDEKNIRFTLSQAIASLPVEVDTAENGEQALEKVDEGRFAAILLDLRMPGIDGMEVLRRLRDERPEIPVVIITAHGNIESAVEAMKLGAIEFLPKPFVPNEIRSLVSRVLDRHKLADEEAHDYATCFELAKRCIAERHFDAAAEHLKRATGIDPERPEAFNLLGVIHELRREHTEAMNNYRVAYHTDPTYAPSRENLERAGSSMERTKPIVIGELRASHTDQDDSKASRPP
jgi:DNA-binding response OmpR family regulator